MTCGGETERVSKRRYERHPGKNKKGDVNFRAVQERTRHESPWRGNRRSGVRRGEE